MKKIRAGIVGLGQRGMMLLRTSLACDNAEITMVCDSYADRVEQAQKVVMDAKGYSPKGCTDFKEMLQSDEVDAMIIASSWDEHIKMAIQSMRAGKITAMEVGGAYNLEECWELVRAYEETQTPIMMLENCCYDEFELLSTSLIRAGKLGTIVHCHGAYGHDLRREVLGGRVNRHYRLDNYIHRNAENYPTHELGPIAKILDINRGNRMLSLVSMASKAAGMEEFSYSDKNPDKTLVGQKFKQGDIVNTIIKCANGETISLVLDTCLPRYYSRDFTVHGTKGLCTQDSDSVMLEEDINLEGSWNASDVIEECLHNAKNYRAYLPDFWVNVTEEEKELGHGGMDYYMMKEFFDAALSGAEMPIDVYDAASWMCITALSEQSIALGGAPQIVPDFTEGKWIKRPRKDVVAFPHVVDKRKQ